MRNLFGFVLLVIGIALVSQGCSKDQYSYERASEALSDHVFGQHRINVAILVAPGRSQEALRLTLKRAAEDLAAEYEAQIVFVRAYDKAEDVDPEYGWTIGKAIYGPDGHIGGLPDAPRATTVELGMDTNRTKAAEAADSLAAADSTSG